MVPSSVLGLVVFVLLLAPGLAYVLCHERVVPTQPHSAFRETLRVVFVSVGCLIVTSIAFAGIRSVLPEHTLDVRGLVQDPTRFAREHHVQIAWWSLAFLTVATAVGVATAHLQLSGWRLQRRGNRFVWVNRTTRAPLSSASAWDKAMHESVPHGHSAYAGAQLDDGSYISGYVASHSPIPQETENRDLLLVAPKMRMKDGTDKALPAAMTVISSRHIVRLDVTHVPPPSPQGNRPSTAEDETPATP
ncbi:DUF6338 family protein [Micromonospora sp. WMMD1102]|uniref:DUF6338 family protein n=1 Tax=Micromonospora sp. WMMD1102 TaxID=3016105 RepID=UPI00241582AD|nr:DUF6338 family protein [Micromonospora sp. WMMD1102]MDG4787657.1 DUF6338 family protein [Micromonospora sp. WMMD1102]